MGSLIGIVIDRVTVPTFVTIQPTPRDRRAATGAAVVMVAVAILATLFGRAPGSANAGVVAALIGAIVVTELLSACLLFSQFVEIREPRLAAIAGAYLFTGECIVGYLLTFPQLVAPHGLFGANEQTAVVLWSAWHVAFPLGIVVAILIQRRGAHVETRARAMRAFAIVAVGCTAFAALLIFLCARFAPALPVFLGPRGFTALTVGALLPSVCVVDVLALLLLVRNRGSSTIDLWLPVAVFASMLDAAMAVAAQRYSFVWYAGKFFAVASSSVMLTVFLVQIARIAKSFAQASAKLRELSDHIARHDSVTGLPNRRHALERLSQAIASDGRATVLSVNVDRFQTVNEAIGTAATEQMLCEIARRIRTCARENAFVASCGNGEFLVLLSGGGGSDVFCTAHEIMETVREPHVVNGRRFFPSASIGVAVAPQDAREPDALLDAAAMAVHLAKRDGGNQVRFYRSEMQSAAVELLDMEADLRSAIRRGQFRVYYQPVVDLTTRQTVAVEALLRWQHPERGLLAPDSFIPAAEQNGMIVQIGAWALDTVARQVRLWHDAGLTLTAAVNFSVREFQDASFYERLAAAITRHRLEPRMLTIEITESLAMDESEQTRRTFERCRELGVTLSLDDFGTSHACLANVKRLPINALKIDKAFTRGIVTERTDAAIVTAVLSFAKSLGLETVAEGIEDVQQLQWLRSAGCRLGQGYYFSRPVPVEEIQARLAGESRQTA